VISSARRIAAIGGKTELLALAGEPHAFVNDRPDVPDAAKAIAILAAFIRRFGGAPRARRTTSSRQCSE
jgi:acetyl esterase/lipase